MGRKGTYGGTAGGGRSGRKGGITYTRVIPKFLQRLTDPESISNPLDAKRPGATGHMKEPKPRDGETEKKPEPECDSETGAKQEIERLEAQGFNVVTEAHGETELGEERNETGPHSGGRRVAPRRSDIKLQVVGGIEKKSKTTPNKVGEAFDMKNRHKLSFAETDSEDE